MSRVVASVLPRIARLYSWHKPARPVVWAALVLGALLAIATVLGAVSPEPSQADIIDDATGAVGSVVDDVVGGAIGGSIKEAFEAVVELLIPDWLVKHIIEVLHWFVSVPDVTRGSDFKTVRVLEANMRAVGIALLTLLATVAIIKHGILQGGRGLNEVAVARLIGAAVLMAVYPSLIKLGIQFTNTFTTAVVKWPPAQEGLERAIGATLGLSLAGGAIGLGLASIAALGVLGCLIGLFIFKLGTVAILAVLMVSAPLAIACWASEESDWVTRMWGTALGIVLVVPIVWALLFATGGALMVDAFHWSSKSNEGLVAFVKPFSALALLIVALKVPGLMWQLLSSRAGGVRAGQLRSNTANRAKERVSERGQQGADKVSAKARGVRQKLASGVRSAAGGVVRSGASATKGSKKETAKAAAKGGATGGKAAGPKGAAVGAGAGAASEQNKQRKKAKNAASQSKAKASHNGRSAERAKKSQAGAGARPSQPKQSGTDGSGKQQTPGRNGNGGAKTSGTKGGSPTPTSTRSNGKQHHGRPTTPRNATPPTPPKSKGLANSKPSTPRAPSNQGSKS